jgi:hypothetical protein
MPIVGKLDLGMSAIGFHVDSQCGYLKVNFVSNAYGQRAVFEAFRVDYAHVFPGEYLDHLLGQRIRGKVNVVRFDVEQ